MACWGRSSNVALALPLARWHSCIHAPGGPMLDPFMLTEVHQKKKTKISARMIPSTPSNQLPTGFSMIFPRPCPCPIQVCDHYRAGRLGGLEPGPHGLPQFGGAQLGGAVQGAHWMGALKMAKRMPKSPRSKSILFITQVWPRNMRNEFLYVFWSGVVQVPEQLRHFCNLDSGSGKKQQGLRFSQVSRGW